MVDESCPVTVLLRFDRANNVAKVIHVRSDCHRVHRIIRIICMLDRLFGHQMVVYANLDQASLGLYISSAAQVQLRQNQAADHQFCQLQGIGNKRAP